MEVAKSIARIVAGYRGLSSWPTARVRSQLRVSRLEHRNLNWTLFSPVAETLSDAEPFSDFRKFMGRPITQQRIPQPLSVVLMRITSSFSGGYSDVEARIFSVLRIGFSGFCKSIGYLMLFRVIGIIKF